MKTDKATFLSLVRGWAKCAGYNHNDLFNLDPDVSAAFNAVLDAQNNMIAVCKRKLEEAGIKP